MKLFRWTTLCLASLLFCLWLGSCVTSPDLKAVSLYMGSAGLTRNALEEIGKIYQQENPNVVLNYTFAGTRLIKGAIEKGEPFDGVLFAETAPLDELQAKGLILPTSRKDLLTTDVVVIAPIDSPLQISDFRELANDRIKTVAIGGAGLAIGNYTRDILTRLGIAQVVEAKAVLAEVDVREVLRAVEQGEAEVGITVLPEARSSAEVKVLATAPPGFYDPIRSAVAGVKTSAHPREIQAYIDFLSSDRAQAVFQKFGLRPLMS